MIFLTPLFYPPNGKPFAKAFTDQEAGSLQFHLRAAGIHDAPYQQPRIVGAEVASGGFSLLTSRQHAAMLKHGATEVEGITPDLPLREMLVVARAATPKGLRGDSAGVMLRNVQ